MRNIDKTVTVRTMCYALGYWSLFIDVYSPLDILCGDSDFPKTCLRKIRPQFRVHQMIYELFSRLKLPQKQHRYDAIAEIESLLAKETRKSALYGVFTDEMARGLLWKRADDEATLRPIRFFRRASIPTWSWMAYSGAIGYLNVPVDQRGVRWEVEIRDHSSRLGYHQLRVFGYLSEDSERIKAVYDVPMTRGRGNIEKRIVMATYEPEDGDYATDYILIVESPLKDLTGYGSVCKRIGVGELERPKARKGERLGVEIRLE